MKLEIGPHLEEAELEQYSMGTLADERVAPFEEHLMACDSCQDQLLEMEAYINAVRSVSPKLRPADPPRPTRFRTHFSGWAAWTGAAATVAALVLLARLWIPAPTFGPATLVILQASRGGEGLPLAVAAVGHSLLLQIDVTEISAPASSRLEIVQSTGKQVLDMGVVPKDGKIVQSLNKGLPAGKYYVRIYSGTSELQREYGLQIR